MFNTVTEPTRKGKTFALIPQSYRTISNYVAGPFAEDPNHYAVAAYWYEWDKGVLVSCFGYFSVIVRMEQNNQQYYAPLIPSVGLSLSFDSFLSLSPVRELETHEKTWLEYSHKLGKQRPYSAPQNKAFPNLEDFYNPEFLEEMHKNPYYLPEGTTGWLKWSDKIIPTETP